MRRRREPGEGVGLPPQLVHHPFDSFAASFEAFLNGAAADPNVIALKSTVYRTSDDTPLVPAVVHPPSGFRGPAGLRR